MANNQELYNTLFLLESDLLWNCDECGGVYDSIPVDRESEDKAFWDEESEGEDLWEDNIGEVIKCRYCNNLIAVDDLMDGHLCPICFEDLSGELKDFDEE